MVNRVEEENSEEGLGIGNFVDVAYGMHEELVGDLSGGDGSQAEDVEPPIVLEPDLGKKDPHTSQLSGNSPTITKLPIKFDEDGVIVGPNRAKWNTQVGIYVRSHIPIHYKDWRKIDGSFKDNVWNKLMVRKNLSLMFPKQWHTEKLKKTFPKSSDQQSMPLGKRFCVSAGAWKKLLQHAQMVRTQIIGLRLLEMRVLLK
ncbi:hypothetical protein IFM89_016127 [Coptis chinensis]|uniref:Uncharacterized protein n=1 Tax=Coptis chinensis TaxID=261450 RepID=A0A835LIQ6_9MAGN|nr:hypothetical protein IFM89_016127 [Coptis chinensis]